MGSASITDAPDIMRDNNLTYYLLPTTYYLLPTTYYLLSYFLLINNTYYPQNPGWGPLVAPARGAHFRALLRKVRLPFETSANLQRARKRAKRPKKLPGPTQARRARGVPAACPRRARGVPAARPRPARFPFCSDLRRAACPH